MSGRPAAPFLVHGMGREPAEPDWEPLRGAEVAAVLACYEDPGAGPPGAADITWRSPRPMSAAGLARVRGATVFVKRHHRRVRSPAALAAEHAFAGHLRDRGLTVPPVLRTAAGGTALARGDWVYEVHGPAPGTDTYRDAVSWSPYAGPGHARAAGQALARLHLAAAAFPWPARPPGVLMNSCALITAANPLDAAGRLLSQRPALARYLSRRRWRDDLASHLLPAITRAGPLLARLPRQWGHGDWHPSNLTWNSAASDAAVVAIFDFGLANRTYAVHDLAIALERATVAWLDLPETGRACADLGAVDALLDGYEAVRPLTGTEHAALAAVLPAVHLEYALSEVEYFAGVVRSPQNANLAYEDYLLGHARWFTSPEGAALLGHLAARARRAARAV